MSNYDATVEVLRVHLEEVWRALDSAADYHVADDLRERYKNGDRVVRHSNLTKRLEGARDRVNAYLIPEEEDDIPEE